MKSDNPPHWNHGAFVWLTFLKLAFVSKDLSAALANPTPSKTPAHVAALRFGITEAPPGNPSPGDAVVVAVCVL
jgi:hypothetical protein